MQVADIIDESIVDGIGLRAVIFCQGCIRQCEGCHNPSALPFVGGHYFTVEELAERIFGNPLLSGVTFSGGEPFCYAFEFAQLARLVRARGLNVWCYTGYTLEELMQLSIEDKDIKALLSVIDVLVDGPFLIEQRDLNLKFRGSNNQRLIDLQSTLNSGNITTIM